MAQFCPEHGKGIHLCQVLQKIITGLDELYAHDIADLDMQGDLYEYMLGKLSAAGQNGQFRTPKHIREMMVALLDPKPDDRICDKAVTRLIQGIPQKGLISGLFANGRPRRSYFFALLPVR